MRALAGWLVLVASAFGDVGRRIEQAVSVAIGPRWVGSAAAEARAAHRRQRLVLDELAVRLHEAARALHRLARALEETAGTEVGAEEAAVADRIAAAAVDRVTTEIDRLAAHCGGALALDLVAPADAWLLARLGVLDRADLPASVVLADVRRLVAAGEPLALRAYVESLSAAQRRQLVDTHPELVGPTPGMPPDLRYAANRLLMVDALAAASPLRARHLAALLADPTRQFLFFDAAGDGRIAEVFGDLDTAWHIALVVPGICNTLANFGRNLAPRAANLHRQVGALAPGAVATVAWLGYDTPGVIDAPFAGRARVGAEELVRQAAGVLPRPGATTTVVAHSYGTLLVGEALRRGLRVDNVVVAGSPGMGVDAARDLQAAPGTRLYALRAPGDEVSWSENFGRDPSDPRFGAVRLSTGAPATGGAVGHNEYFSGTSESTRNIARVVAGDTGHLTVLPPEPLDVVVGAVSDTIAPDLPLPDPVTHLYDRLRDPDLYWDVLGDEGQLYRKVS